MIVMVWHLIKESIIAASAVLIGWVSTIVYNIILFQTTGIQIFDPPWYEHPAVISALVTGIILFSIKYYERRSSKKDQTDEKHQTYSDKLAEITERGWQEYLKQLKELELQKDAFSQAEIMKLEVDSYRDRLIKHACFNEIQRLHGHIHDLDLIISKFDSNSVPEFVFKYQPDILEGIDDKVREYRQSLRNNLMVAKAANKEKEQ